jgi:hypothetical protein
VWRCVLTALAGRFGEAERLARDSVALAEWASTCRARALRRAARGAPARAGPSRRVVPELERFARDEPPSDHGTAFCRSPTSTPATGRVRAPPYNAALAGGVSAVLRTFWLISLMSLAETAAPLGDAAGRSAPLRRARAARRPPTALELHRQRELRAPPAGPDGGRREAARPRVRAFRGRSEATRRAWLWTAARPDAVRLRRAAS